MGSFHYTGWHSRTPIRPGNRTVTLIGLVDKNISIDTFGPGFRFTPIALPIRGSYNDYGGIEDIDDTASSRYITEFFGEPAEDIISNINSNDIPDSYITKIVEKINSLSGHIRGLNLTDDDIKLAAESMNESVDELKRMLGDSLGGTKYTDESFNQRYTLSVIFEHENVFDAIVSVGNPTLLDYHFWQIPSELLISLGYTETKIGVKNSYDIVSYKHATYPELIRDCYIYTKDVYDENQKNKWGCHNAITCMRSLFNAIGITDIPEMFKTDYYLYAFRDSVYRYTNKLKFNVDDRFGDDFVSYMRTNNYCRNHLTYSLFKYSEYRSTNNFLCIYDDDDLLKEENEKEAADMGGLLAGMSNASIVFGTSNYASEGKSSYIHGIIASAVMDNVVNNIREDVECYLEDNSEEDDADEYKIYRERKTVIDKMKESVKDLYSMCIDNKNIFSW